LILRKISKSDAIRCQILNLKCIKSDFRWGFAQDPAGKAYSASTDALVVFKGPTSKGKAGKEEGRGKEGKREGKGREDEGEVMGGEGDVPSGPKYFGLEPPMTSLLLSFNGTDRRTDGHCGVA